MKRVFAFVGFSSAITLIVLNTVPYSFSYFILIAAVISLWVSLLIKKSRQERVLPVTFGAVLFSCLIFILCTQCVVLPQKALDGKTAQACFQITDIETKTDNGYLYTVKTKSIDLPDAPQNIKIKLKTDVKIDADYYDDVSGTLSFYSFADNGFDSFGDYGDNIFIRANLFSYVSGKKDGKPLNYYIIQLRLSIKDILEDNLDEEKAGLALSIFTGDKRLLYDDINNSFKACGISHMTAVSGLHISVICLCVYYLLKFLKTPRPANTIATLTVLLIYSGVADYSKSVLRAGIMITVMLLAKLINNRADTLNSLGFAVFLICLNPFAVTDASAVLTVTSVIGLSVVKPAYDKILRPQNKWIRYFYDGLFTGISVLLSTLPAMWLFFGKVSLMSLILNIIGIPIMEIALVSILLLCVFSGVPFLAFIPKSIASFSLGALINIADFSKEHFEFLYLNISDSLFGIVISGALLLLGISLLVNYKIDIRIISVLMAVILAATTAFSIYDYSRNIYLTVSDNGAVILYDRDSVVLIDVDEKGDCYAAEDIVGTKKYDRAVAIRSLSCKNEITEILPNIQFISSKDAMPDLCEHISIEADNSVLTVTLSDKVFKIDKDCVTISGYKAYRNIYDRFSESGDVTFIVTPNSEIQVKEG